MRNFRFNKPAFVLMLLPLAALLNDSLTFQLGSIFVTPYKIALIVSASIFVQESISLINQKSNKLLSNIGVVFIGYCLLLLFSVFYSDVLRISQRINYSLFIVCEIILITGLTYKLQNIDFSKTINSLKNVVLFIFVSSLILSTAQLILKDQIIYTGLFASRKVSYAITGFNIERLFLSEFLIFGMAMIMFTKRYTKLARAVLFLWVGFLIVFSGSFTGILGFTGFTLTLIRKINYKLLSIVTMLIISVTLLSNANYGEKIEARLAFNDDKFDSYYTNASEENWRLISSLALINEVISHPTVFGHGYLSSAIFLKDINYSYSKQKYGISKATDKANTSHTFFSVIYDQGLVGLGVITIFIMMLIALIIKLFKKRNFNSGSTDNLILKLTLIIGLLVLLRFSFYYHTINHWHYLILIILSNMLRLSRIKGVIAN